jgi:hypothetical protein
MTGVTVESPGARVRQLRRHAAHRGMLVHKSGNDPNFHRYIILEREPHMIKLSHNFDFPYSFSLEEAELYVARWV